MIRTNEEKQAALDLSMKEVVTIPRDALIRSMLSNLNVQLSEYYTLDSEVCDFLNNKLGNGELAIKKGRLGGVYKPTPTVPAFDQVKSYIDNRLANGSLVRVSEQAGGIALANTGVTPAINDHVCPHCNNNRVSKSERSCWNCGGNLHA